MSDEKFPAKASALPSASRSEQRDIEAFIRHARALSTGSDAPAGRLILALDATMSCQPTWDLACALQAQMFDAVGKAGRLTVQLVYFRGAGECRSSKFLTETASLKRLMTGIECRGGQTQIGKVLAHVIRETADKKINAVVYIGDAMEESIDDLAEKAGNLGLHGVPMFVFQEGRDRLAEKAFREIARLSRGAWFRFDRNAAATLANLLSSIAVFAAGGLKALEARGRPEDRLLIENLGGTQVSILLGLLAGILIVVLIGAAFVRLDARQLASALRTAGPIILAVLGAGVILIGRAGIGGAMLSGALAWYASSRARGSAPKTPGRRSTVRTAALEMELDHDTGGLEGLVLAGTHEAKVLSAMDLKGLLSLYGELGGDPESRQLLEAYLDGRFPVWREHADANRGGRQGVSPGSGSMTKEEAYKILGLEAGAAAADVRKAHRRLMQRLHPDIGGTSFLAARINEAKDVLLSNHN